MKTAVTKYFLAKYRPNSDSALSPVEFKKMHNNLLPNLCTSVCNLQFLVMTLFGINLFLRGNEITSLNHEDIEKELAVMSYNGTIECLPIHTLGKKEDDAPATLEI